MVTAVMPTYGRWDVAVERGEGVYLYATDGRKFLDLTSGIAVTSLGHCHPHVIEAVTKQAGQLWHSLEPVPHPGAGKAGRAAGRQQLCRHRVLQQLGRRGVRDVASRSRANTRARPAIPRSIGSSAATARSTAAALRRSPPPGPRRTSRGSARRWTGSTTSPGTTSTRCAPRSRRRPPASSSSRCRAKAACAPRRPTTSRACARCATSTG